MMMEQLQLDLNMVKKEPQYFEDYGQSAGNILDNIIPESEFDQFGQGAPSVPNSDEMDQGVDWLSSFFDEPSHDTCNVNGLNPPISKLSDITLSTAPTYPSVVKILTSNSQNGLLSDSLNMISDDYVDEMVYKSPNSVRPPSPDPFLAPTQERTSTLLERTSTPLERTSTPLERTNTHFVEKLANTSEIDIITAIRKAQNFKILSQVDRQTLNLTTARELIQRLKESQQNQADTLREQRLGHIMSQKVNQRSDLSSLIVKRESESNDCDSGNHSLLSRISCTVPELSSLRNGRPLCYESPTQLSPGCVVSSPTGCLQEPDCSSSSTENTPIGDQLKDRVPFYLSEEERRTLITEGLPIPTATPLSKAEERALKKVRRKIKNKISAQESRRKKKEYMEALEKKIEVVNGNNSELRKKVDTLENTNKSLTMQLHKLQASIAVKGVKYISTKTTQTTQSQTEW